MKKEITTLIKEIVEIETGQVNIEKRDRHLDIKTARHIYFYLCKCYTKLSLDKIGSTLNRDHATVLNSFKKVTTIIETKDVYLDWVIKCEEKLCDFIKNGDFESKINLKEKVSSEAINSLVKKIEELEMQLFVEKQRSKYRSQKHKQMEDYLNKIPSDMLDDFFMNRVVPYAKMCESKVIN